MGELIDGGPCGINSPIAVFVTPGRSLPLRLSEKLSDGDPEWVTVHITTDLDETWVNILRYTFFGVRD